MYLRKKPQQPADSMFQLKQCPSVQESTETDMSEMSACRFFCKQSIRFIKEIREIPFDLFLNIF